MSGEIWRLRGRGERPRGGDVGPCGCGCGAPPSCSRGWKGRREKRVRWAGVWTEVQTGPPNAGRPRARPDGAGVGEWRGGALEIESLDAEGMGGRMEATGKGQWSACPIRRGAGGWRFGAGARRDVRTGQQTLLPRHVRGRAEWFAFPHLWPKGNNALGCGLPRADGTAELIGFELLQEIPEVLESERKYRLIADAQD